MDNGSERHKRRRLIRPAQHMVLAFAALIVIGAIALELPWSTPDSQPVSLIDALFTSTSAVCVTGLVVRDTGSGFSHLGQAIILILIQLGGLGILAFGNFLIFSQQRAVGIGSRMLLEESYGVLPGISPRALVGKIIFYTLGFELVGAAILSLRFMADFSAGQAIWQGLFHAVSAYCNAGFGLFKDSMMSYQDDFWVNAVVISLIILGGLGFIVFADLSNWRRNWALGKRVPLRLHTRVVLLTTAVLLVGGWLAFMLLEWNAPAMDGPWWTTIHKSLFLSATARTAGFNSVDTAQLTNPSLLILLLLMMVGGSPGSTAGGFKTTTAATLFAMLSSRMRNRPRVELLGRSLSGEQVAKAVTTAVGFFLLVLTGMVLVELFQVRLVAHSAASGKGLDYLFEVVSALCTVGLSTGVTPTLSTGGKLVTIALMYLGRLGPLLVAASLVGWQRRLSYHLPQEDLNIG